MSVNKLVYLGDGGLEFEEFNVEGSTFSPVGKITYQDASIPELARVSSTVREMAEISALCNDSRLALDEKTGIYTSVGEPTEGALRVLVEKIGTPVTANGTANGNGKASALHNMDKSSTWYENQARRLATYEFSRDRKSMSVLVGDSNTQRLLVKGAPEALISRCSHAVIGASSHRVPMDQKVSDLLMKEITAYGNRGLRVIALASRDVSPTDPRLHNSKTTKDYLELEQGLTLIGLVGMSDPPRPEVASSIRKVST